MAFVQEHLSVSGEKYVFYTDGVRTEGKRQIAGFVRKNKFHMFPVEKNNPVPFSTSEYRKLDKKAHAKHGVAEVMQHAGVFVDMTIEDGKQIVINAVGPDGNNVSDEIIKLLE